MTHTMQTRIGVRITMLAAGLCISSSVAAAVAPTPVAPPASAAAAQEPVWDGDLLPPGLDEALTNYCSFFENPAAKRAELIQKLTDGNRCYSRRMSAAQWQNALENLDMLPPGIFNEPGGQRFFTSSNVWVGNGTVQNASGRAQSANLTVSFPIDGVAWDGGNNVLDARLGTVFGVANKDRGREFIRQALANWELNSGLRYTEVDDDDIGFTTSTAHSTLRGDIRIGARSQDGAFGILAYNNFPANGGDMVLDADEYVGGEFTLAANNYRGYRNTIAHEHGHGTGYIHSVPCNDTKLMEPSLSTSFEMLEVDDIRGAQRNYGDRFAGNNSAANAKNFGNLTTPILKSIIEKNLSTNGTSGFSNTDEDWFRFTIDSAQNVVITADPTGGTYVNGQQTAGCSGSTSSIVADQAGNLNVELRDSAGTTVLMTAASAATGVSEVLNAAGLAAGTYTVRVFDVGPNANQTVQLYDLTLRVGTAKAPPTACAGINKRIAVGSTCFFMGNINSYANDTGSAISAYAWDLDGDGTFEITNNAQPNRVYTANGTTTVTLRVTDNFGMTATDTIQVVAFGAACPITIDTQPTPLTRCEGQSATFTVAGTSTGTLTYQWRRNASNVAGATSSSLVINPVNTSHAGNYDCVVTSSCGASATSNFATLTVNALTTFTSHPMSQSASPGDTVILSVTTSAGEMASYQWKKNNNNVPGGTNSALLLLNVAPSDSGTYRCDVTTTCGTVQSNDAVLTIASPCVCDWNSDGFLTSQDFFDFISAFFAGTGDFNLDGTTTSQDFFDFISCFFAGCD